MSILPVLILNQTARSFLLVRSPSPPSQSAALPLASPAKPARIAERKRIERNGVESTTHGAGAERKPNAPDSGLSKEMALRLLQASFAGAARGGAALYMGGGSNLTGRRERAV